MDPLRIGTFNLLHGVPVLGAGRDLEAGSDDTGAVTADPAAGGFSGPPPVRPELLRAAAATLDADVLGLQEVDRRQDRSHGADQTADVADALGAAHWRFVPALHGTPGERSDWTVATEDDGALTEGPTYGVGLVSRLPVLKWEVRRFPAARFSIPLLVPAQPRPRLIRVPDEPRVALAAVIDGPAGPFTVLTAHLSFVPGTNVRQLRALTRWASSLPQPVVLAGDLNLPGRAPARVSGWNALVRVATYPTMRPRIQFDHLLGHGIDERAVVGHGATALEVSDHCALWADLDLG